MKVSPHTKSPEHLEGGGRVQSPPGKTKETGSGGQVNGGWMKLGRDRETQPMGWSQVRAQEGRKCSKSGGEVGAGREGQSGPGELLPRGPPCE